VVEPAAQPPGANAAELAATIEGVVTPIVARLGEAVAALAANAAAAATVQGAPAEVAAPPPASAAPALDFEPYLERLDATLAALAHKPAGVAVMQRLGPGVLDLLERLADQVDDALLPLIQGLGRRLDALQLEDDRGTSDLLDKSLKRLDELKELVSALRKIDTGRMAGEGGIGR
jgi:hypothetical protein